MADVTGARERAEAAQARVMAAAGLIAAGGGGC